MRKRVWIALILAVVAASGVLANEALQATTCDVPADKVIEGNLYVVCQDLTVAGRIEGSIIGVAINAQISGTVMDDIYLLARTLTVDGNLNEDMLVVSGSLTIGSEVTWNQGDLIALAADARVESGAQLPGSLTMVGYQLALDGNITDDLLFFGESLALSGAVEGDVEARTAGVEPTTSAPVVSALVRFFLNAQQAQPGLRLSADSHVAGNLSYTSPSEAMIEGKVTGVTDFTQSINPPTIDEFVAEDSRIDALRAYFAQVVQDVLVLSLVGALMLLLWPRSLLRPVEALGEKLVRNSMVGFGALVLSVPILTLLVVLSVILVALLVGFVRIDALSVVVGTALGLTTFGGGGLFYFIVVYVARTVTAAALGSTLIYWITQADLSRRQRLLGVTVGAVLIALLGAFSPVGWVVNLLSAAIGLGAIWRAVDKALKRPAPPPSASSVVRVGSEAALSPHLPPPLSDSKPVPRGMENLPNGFHWWDNE